ncbi:PD-(D/E)XK nuclease family protein [Microbulbifer sp. 2201CG32-9]|uniref:PD-(D/E)XK nuclease family protein n=1 Tax=Microbulbifer sp. 2201CG32-9 TaxID=3232309 RepID=UPI00345C2EB4
MLTTAFPVLDILRQLPPGGLLLTPNNRLRNRCQQLFASAQKPGASWSPPPVESLQGWFEKLWLTLQQQGWGPALRQVLNREQRELLWRRALDQGLTQQLLNSQRLCGYADTALAQLIQWQLVEDIERPDRDLEPLLDQFALSLSRDDLPLLKLLESFAYLLHSDNAITPDQRDQLLLRAFREGELSRLPRIDTAGFAQISPLARQILGAAAEEVVAQLPQPRAAQCHRAPCRDLKQELEQAARWVAAKLRHNPRAGIGVVVNNLGQCRAEVEAIFTRVLEPQFFDPAQPRYTLPFNFSAGTPLAQTPVGSAALQLLELLQEECSYSQLRNLLFAPFLGDDGEVWLRAALLRRLQKLELRRIDGATLRYWAQRTAEQLGGESPQLPLQLERLGEWQRRWHRAPAEIWARRFSDVLSLLQWPGPRTPDSQEYQQLRLWETALEELAALSAFAGLLSLNQALQQLRQIAKRTPFQAETRDGPVQILGVLEAGGLAFDHLRLVGFGQSQWPPAPAPNPLLPLQWQKHWKMPRASAERELELARELSEELLQASPDVVVSYVSEEDGVAQGLSSLFGTPAVAGGVDTDALDTHCRLLATSVSLQSAGEASLPPLTPAECEAVRGGAGVLKAQALCPLNAQLRYRLGAIAAARPGIGLSPAARGSIVHQVLAEFWQACGDSARLCQLQPQARQTLLETAIDSALRVPGRQYRHLPAGFWITEKERLLRLMDQWLAVETARPAFSVTEVEWEQQVEIGGLHFTLRLDRLDQLAGGEQLVIDYKTGLPSLSDWLQERVRDPQLPLYALCQPGARALAFGQVRQGGCRWIGCGDLRQPIEGIKSVAEAGGDLPAADWEALTGHWRSALETLADEYRRGVATLVFDRPQDNLQQSDLWPLNRWPERAQAPA